MVTRFLGFRVLNIKKNEKKKKLLPNPKIKMEKD
jgi:hypothetical protein